MLKSTTCAMRRARSKDFSGARSRSFRSFGAFEALPLISNRALGALVNQSALNVKACMYTCIYVYICVHSVDHIIYTHTHTYIYISTYVCTHAKRHRPLLCVLYHCFTHCWGLGTNTLWSVLSNFLLLRRREVPSSSRPAAAKAASKVPTRCSHQNHS